MDAALAQLVSAAVAVLCFDWALAALMLLVAMLAITLVLVVLVFIHLLQAHLSLEAAVVEALSEAGLVRWAALAVAVKAHLALTKMVSLEL